VLSLDPISDEVLDRIAQLIGHRLQESPVQRLSSDSRLALAETFAVTHMPAHLTGGLSSGPQFSGHWFHMLKSGSKYVGHALTTPIGPALTDWMVEGVFHSELSAQLALCLRWIHKNIDREGTLRLLVEPGHHLHAFTITSDGAVEVVIAHLPRRATSLSKRRTYLWSELIAKLDKAKPVRGVEALATG